MPMPGLEPPRKEDKIPQIEFVPVAIGGALAVTGLIVFGFFVTMNAPPPSWVPALFEWGLGIMAAGTLYPMIYFYLRDRTDLFGTETHAYHAAHLGEGPTSSPIAVPIARHLIDEATLRSALPESEQQTLTEALAYLRSAGMDDSVYMLTPGGISGAAYLRSHFGGQEGIVLFLGNPAFYLLKIGKILLIPHEEIELNQTAIDPLALGFFEDKHGFTPTFKRNRTRVTLILPRLGPGMLDYVHRSPLVHAEVLQQIGYTGLSEKFAREVENFIATSSNEKVADLNKRWDKDATAFLTSLFNKWAVGLPSLTPAMTYRTNLAVHYAILWLESESDRHSLRYEKMLARGEVLSHQLASTIVAQQNVRGYGMPRLPNASAAQSDMVGREASQ